MNWKTGHNLSAFNDLLCGGFGVFEYDEPIKIIWRNFEKSKSDPEIDLTGTKVEKINDPTHIDFAMI